MSFDGWLDARDGETMAREWATLGAKATPLGDSFASPYWASSAESAAVFAADWLGCSPERFAWFALALPGEDDDDDDDYYDDDDGDDDELDDDDEEPGPTWPEPTFRNHGDATRSFLDQEHDLEEPCVEEWQLREVIEGSRGVQHIILRYWFSDDTQSERSGGEHVVVRAFDRSSSRAVAIHLGTPVVFSIGDVDLAPLDLFDNSADYKLAWPSYEIEAARGFVAQLAADIDAHFDVSPSWPGGVKSDEVLVSEYNIRYRKQLHRFESGPYAIELSQNLDADTGERRGLEFSVLGLPWGHVIKGALYNERDDPSFGVSGDIRVRLPRAQTLGVLARLAAVPGIAVTG